MMSLECLTRILQTNTDDLEIVKNNYHIKMIERKEKKMRKFKSILSSDKMLSVFSSLNVMQPWRFQGEVEFYVPFEEYKAFIAEIFKYEHKWLRLARETYLNALQSNDELKLLKLYYNDLAWALIYEIRLAAHYGKDVTMLLPFFENPQETSSIEVLIPKLLTDIERDNALQRLKKDCCVPMTESNSNAMLLVLLLQGLAYKSEVIKINIGGSL